MRVRLLVTNDKANVKKVVLRSNTVIGRSAECNLRIASREVSRKHCAILVTKSQVRVRDLGSSNGTFLNGQRLKPNIDVPLPSGAELEVGNVRFVVQHDAPLPVEEPGSTVEATSPLQVASEEKGNEAVAASTRGHSSGESEEAPTVHPAEQADRPEDNEIAADETRPVVSEERSASVSEERTEEEEQAEEEGLAAAGSEPALATGEAETVSFPLSEASPADVAENALADTVAFDFSDESNRDAQQPAEDTEEPTTDIHKQSSVPVAQPVVETDETSSPHAHPSSGFSAENHPGEETVFAGEAESSSTSSAEAPTRKEGRLKSLFGLLKRRKKTSVQQQETMQEATEEEDLSNEEQDRATVPLNTAEIGTAPELAGIEETVAEVPGSASFDPEETTLEEDLPADEEPVAEVVGTSAEEEAGADEEEEGGFIAPPAAEDEAAEEDEELQDFFRRLSQE